MKGNKFVNWIFGLMIAGLVCLIAFVAVMGNRQRTSAEGITEEATTESVSVENQTESEETENEPSESKSFDLDAFLAFIQTYADEAGLGDEYAKAVEAIKTAASEKQVTISTIATVAQLAVFVVFIVYKNVKDGKLKKQIIDLANKLEAQRDGTNALIDETNAAGKTGTDTNKTVAELKNSLLHLEKAFSLFAERFKIGEASKEEIKRECIQAQKNLDGIEEVTNHENKA